MKNFLVVTITCPDQPGIVERLTDVVEAHGGNWEESRLARLGGDFAGIAMVSVPTERADELTSALASLADDELTVTIKGTSPRTRETREGHTFYSLRLEGADHEGIVHDLSAYLAKEGINVETMETELVAAPMSATPLFHMEAQIDVPSSLTFDDLRKNLLRIGDQLGVDIEVAPAQQRP